MSADFDLTKPIWHCRRCGAYDQLPEHRCPPGTPTIAELEAAEREWLRADLAARIETAPPEVRALMQRYAYRTINPLFYKPVKVRELGLGRVPPKFRKR